MNIALIAHDKKKDDIVKLATAYKDVLAKHRLFATGTTGKLIQDAGLQGLTWGGAQVSIKHAGFIVNIDNATATDYIELIEHIQEVILEKFDVELEREVRIIGESIEETSRI